MDDAFEERRKKNEDKWALDQHLAFKALARRSCSASLRLVWTLSPLLRRTPRRVGRSGRRLLG